jgi:phenylacetate-CoA ligase
MHQLYMSSYHLAPAYTAAYLDALRKHRITYLLGYASSMYALAQSALEQGLAAPGLRVAISNAEPLYEYQRETIARVFDCPVRDTYGMAEIACAASECSAGAMHIWPEVGIIEVLQEDGDIPVQAGQTGRFICTGLQNADMPLIRYQVGDRGALAADQQGCACGRPLPILKVIEGRLDDVVVTRDGRRIGRLDPVFKMGMPIREAQIIQETLDRLHVRFVPIPSYTDRDGVALIRRLRDRVGDVEVVLEPVAHLPRSANGKFRAVISLVGSSSNESLAQPELQQ